MQRNQLGPLAASYQFNTFEPKVIVTDPNGLQVVPGARGQVLDVLLVELAAGETENREVVEHCAFEVLWPPVGEFVMG